MYAVISRKRSKLQVNFLKDQILFFLQRFLYCYLHGSLGYGHVEILQDVVWIFTASVTFEGVSYAHRLLSVPRRIVQAWRGQCWIRWYRHVHAGVCIVLHIVRVY